MDMDSEHYLTWESDLSGWKVYKRSHIDLCKCGLERVTHMCGCRGTPVPLFTDGASSKGYLLVPPTYHGLIGVKTLILGAHDGKLVWIQEEG